VALALRYFFFWHNELTHIYYTRISTHKEGRASNNTSELEPVHSIRKKCLIEFIFFLVFFEADLDKVGPHEMKARNGIGENDGP
jgi:hypothetical protein